MNNLKVTIIQADIKWEDKDHNLSKFSEKIDSIDEETDLIVLPEMFTTGFSMHPRQFAETVSGSTISWMQQKASEKKCVITGSFICEESGRYYNRLIWMKPDGKYSTYDKHHLFSMGDENNHYTAGSKKIVEEIRGWKICPLICYDLRFPLWSRNTVSQHATDKIISSAKEEMLLEYDVLIYAANWPEKRIHAWKTLLMARAIENQSFVIGVNRVGNDDNGIYYSGDSAVINPTGDVISKMKPHEEGIENIVLNYEELMEFRKSFPVYKDADNFELKN